MEYSTETYDNMDMASIGSLAAESCIPRSKESRARDEKKTPSQRDDAATNKQQ